jgi:hypothetical protein
MWIEEMGMRDLILRRFDKFAWLGVALWVGAAPVVAADSQRHHVIGATAMKAAKLDFTTTYAIRPDGGLRNLADVYACFNGAVHLPHGVSITRVTVVYASGASTNNPVAAIIQNPLTTSAADPEAITISALPSNSGARKLADLPLTGPTYIDNARYSYALSVCLDGAEKDAFYAVRITYTKLIAL